MPRWWLEGRWQPISSYLVGNQLNIRHLGSSPLWMQEAPRDVWAHWPPWWCALSNSFGSNHKTTSLIREPILNSRPTIIVGSNIVSSSAPPATGWQSVFRLGDQPLPIMSSVRNWANEEGGWIAHSLGRALQLPNDVRYFSDESNEAVALRLEWHTIVVSSIFLFQLFICLLLLPQFSTWNLKVLICFNRLPSWPTKLSSGR